MIELRVTRKYCDIIPLNVFDFSSARLHKCTHALMTRLGEIVIRFFLGAVRNIMIRTGISMRFGFFSKGRNAIFVRSEIRYMKIRTRIE